MSTYSARRVVRKRHDYVGMAIFAIVLIALPVVGYIAYLFVNDPAQLEAYGLKPMQTANGQLVTEPPVAPVAVAPAPAAVANTPSSSPTKSATSNTVAAVTAETPAPTEIAKVDIPAAPRKNSSKSSSGTAGPPTKSGKATTVGQAVEHVGANILEALSIPKKVMVVWLVDESNSAADYRRDLSDGLTKMYAGLKLTKPEGKEIDEQQLISVVAPFGKDVRFATPEPTADSAEVVQAVRDITDAASGEENTIHAIDEALTKFMTYRTQKGRHLMFVVVSDEVGDDQAKVDTILPKLKQHTIPVYVVGVAAPFGSTGETMKLTQQGGGIIGEPDPSSAKGDFKVVFGPESRDVEWIKLAYPDGSGDSGLGDLDMGPYTLSRLCADTGGEYFALRTRDLDSAWRMPVARVNVERSGGGGADKGDSYFSALAAAGGSERALPKLDDAVIIAPDLSSSSAGMTAPATNFKKYAPAYMPEADYQKSIAANKAKQALIAASKMLPTPVLPSDVNTSIDTKDETTKTRSIIAAQKPAALVQPQIDALFEALKKGESDSAKLTEPRWKAAFDLAYGRTMAAKARADGYMFQLASIRNGKAASGLSPSDEPMKNSVVDKLAAGAKERLQRVISEHPGTPWAKAAERELRQPLSWKLDQ